MTPLLWTRTRERSVRRNAIDRPPPPEPAIHPHQVYKNPAERKRARKALLARRKERSKWVDENCGHKDADENGCLHLSTPINISISKLPPFPPYAKPVDKNPIETLRKLGCIFDCRPPLRKPIPPEKIQQLFANAKNEGGSYASGQCRIPSSFVLYKDVVFKTPYVHDRIHRGVTLAIEEYNKEASANYRFVGFVEVGWQLVGGANYHIIFQATMTPEDSVELELETFEARVYSEFIDREKKISSTRLRGVRRAGCTWYHFPLSDDVVSDVAASTS